MFKELSRFFLKEVASFTWLISNVSKLMKIVVVVVAIVVKFLSRSVTSDNFLIWTNAIRRNVARTMSP